MEISEKPIDRKTFFNEAADHWDSNHSNSVKPEFLEMLIARLSLGKSQRVLDVGTGTGILIPLLAKAVGDLGMVVAVDFSERMVEAAKQKFSTLPNVRIELKNVEELDYPDSYFDAVTCFGVFPHIQHKEKALEGINRVLKTKGKLVIAHSLGRKELNQVHRKENPSLARDILPTEEQIAKLLKNCGFEVAYIEDKPEQYLCFSTKR